MYNESKMMRSPPVAVPLVLHIRAERLDLGGEGRDASERGQVVLRGPIFRIAPPQLFERLPDLLDGSTTIA